MTFDCGRWVKKTAPQALSSNYEWILVSIGMNAQIGWFSTTNACLSGSKMVYPIATLWDPRWVWNKMQDPGTQISDDFARYYQCFIVLLCLFNMFAVPEQNRGMSQCSLCWERTHALLDFKNISWSFSMTSQIPRCAMFVLFVAGSAWWIRSGKSMSIQKQDCFWEMSCFSHCWASWTRHFTASPCCAAIKTFDTHPLFDVLALLYGCKSK